MHYCDCKGTTKLQLIQRVFQRMLTLRLGNPVEILIIHMVDVLAAGLIDVQHDAAKYFVVCLVQLLKQTVDEREVVLVVIEIHFSFPFL